MKKGKDRNKKMVSVFLLVLGIISVGIVAASLNNTGLPEDMQPKEIELMSQYQPDRDVYGKGITRYRDIDYACWVENRKFPEKIDSCYTIKSYTFDIKDVFRKLPELPEDFWRIKYSVMKESFIDFCNLDEEYWKQPEILRDTFIETGIRFLKENNPNQWYAAGIGVYPNLIESPASPNKNYRICVLVFTSDGVQTKQGMQIVPYSTHRNITIKVTPDVLLVEEKYPIISQEWIKKIELIISVGNVREGTYEIGFNEFPPPQSMLSQWQTQYPLVEPASAVTPFKMNLVVSE